MDEHLEEFYGRLGGILREKRKEKGVTQQALADQLGLNRTTVVNIERGRQHLYVDQLVVAADELGCDPCDLIPLPAEPGAHLADLLRRKAPGQRAASFVSEVAAASRRAKRR